MFAQMNRLCLIRRPEQRDVTRVREVRNCLLPPPMRGFLTQTYTDDWTSTQETSAAGRIDNSPNPEQMSVPNNHDEQTEVTGSISISTPGGLRGNIRRLAKIKKGVHP